MPPLILGAGPAGCAAAIGLARAGAAPVLLDRDADARDTLCGGFLSWRTADSLRVLGIDLRELGAHAVTRLVLHAGTETAEFALPAPAYGLSRRALDSALRQRAQDCGARLEIDTARSIEGATIVGRHRCWTGDGLFIATGKRDLRGLPRARRANDPALGLRVRLPASSRRRRLLTGRIELHLFDGGYCGIVLHEGGSANLCLAVRKSRFGGDAHALLDRWATASPAFAERLGDDWQRARCDSVGAVPYGFLAHRTEAGLFRLGDQAAVIPSLAGEGIAMALASGTLAARRWLDAGPAAAPGYQREFAARAAWPVRAGSLAWALAERPTLAGPGIALATHLPGAIRWLMNVTRLDMPALLAPMRAAP